MIYLDGCSKPTLHKEFGFLATYVRGISPLLSTENRIFAVDNNCFNSNFDEKKFYHFIENRVSPYKKNHLFVTCPDKLKDPKSTLALYKEHYTKIKTLGYEIAFVCQDEQVPEQIPSDCDWIFIGGSTEWKTTLSFNCIEWANKNRKKVHIGRVNGFRRLKLFAPFSINSVDGNGVARNPTYNTEYILRVLARARKEIPHWFT